MGRSLQRDLRTVMRFRLVLLLLALVWVLVLLLPAVSAVKNLVIDWEDDDSRESVDLTSDVEEDFGGEEGASEEEEVQEEDKIGRLGLSPNAGQGPAVEWDEFGDSDDRTDDDLDPGSWSQILENPESSKQGREYAIGVRMMFQGVSEGEPQVLSEAIRHLQADADQGNAHAQSTLAFLLGIGYGTEQSNPKAFLLHHFAAEGGNFQSKMALAYSYSRQQMHEEAVKLYAELAATAMASFRSSKDIPLMEPVRLNDGFKESSALKKFRGEDDDDFQFLEYQAHKGYTEAMYRLGVFYYLGLRGVRHDHSKALTWLLKAAEKSDPRSMELLGEIYARGYGVERNYSRAYEWFVQAARQKHYSALNGIGYLYVKGQGVTGGKNHTMAKEYFRRAADTGDSHGNYNLGVLYLQGMGVKKDVKEACKNFLMAADKGHPKAFYQLAKMQQKGIPGMKKDVATAAALYKVVAERGPWGSLMRWALECYLKGQIGKALLLYSRAAELGYEAAQSNAAWILEKYHGEGICLGKSGLCTDMERHKWAHMLWHYASEQGNEHAALLIGDTYFYGRGTEKDLDRAAAAYARAQSQQNAQAMFNLGYMYEHGLGLPKDLHLAKRHYDQALDTEPAAALPVTLALTGLWLRQHYGKSFIVKAMDSLPETAMKVGDSFMGFFVDEGNVTLVTLFVCLLTVLYMRQRQRRTMPVNIQPPPQ